eukprot:jgi/Ulvmu1/1960/UM012_0121.1
MKDVLTEQRRDRVSRTGFCILKDIEAECSRVETTTSTFLQRNVISRFASASSTVEALRESRVSLHEHWTLYLITLSTAGSAPVATSQFQIPSGHSTPAITSHLSHFSRAITALSSHSADSSGAQQQLRDLRRNPPGPLSDAQEYELAVVVAQVQTVLAVPPDAFAGAAAAVTAQLDEMRAAMARSVAAGLAGLSSQLQAILEQNEEIAVGTRAILAEVKSMNEVWDAVAFGDTSRVLPGGQHVLRQFAAAVKREERCVFDQSVMACPATGVRFTPTGDAAPTLVPGCHCTVARAIAEKYQQEEHCGVCQQHVPGDGELKLDRVALSFLDDLSNNRLPTIRKFDIRSDFSKGDGHSTRQGTEGVVRFGTLRGEPVAVKTVEFATADASLRQWRCRRHVLLNSICTQHRAARASANVCDVVGLCWGETCAHIAMPRYQMTLEDHIKNNATRGMPLHRVLELCSALTRAVHDVHAWGILHCDINPSNVLLADDGTPRLIDFGLSHINRNGLETRTSMGHTLQYAPPEQVAGRVNEASDVYALGRTLAYAATGCKPSHSGQKLPEDSPELKEQLEAMTGTEEARKAIRLLQVIAVFEDLVKQHGRTPVAQVHTAADLASQLAFGDTLDMGGREIALADGQPSEQPTMHVVSEKEEVNESLHVLTWGLRAAPESPCWELQQAGAALRAVTLALPEHGQLHVVNGTAAGAWHGVTVKGQGHSTVVVTGPMTLEGVTFDGCTLVGTGTADLTVSACAFKNCEVAAFVTGASTSASFKSCKIDDCPSGLVVADGALAAVDATCKLKCSGNGYCVAAHGEGASAIVTGATLRYATGEAFTAVRRACVAALHAGTVSVDGRATLAGSGRAGGVLSWGPGSTASLQQCDIAVSSFGIWAGGESKASATGCAVQGASCALVATEKGRITTEECEVSECREHGAGSWLGGHLTLTNCNLSGTRENCGVSVSGTGSDAVVTGGSITSSHGCGVVVAKGAGLTAQGCTVKGNVLDGLYVCHGGQATLHNCRLLDSNRGGGVVVCGAGSSVTAEDCKFSGNALHGVRAYDGGKMQGTNCEASKNGSREEFAGLSTRSIASRGSSTVPLLSAELSRGSSGSEQLQRSGGIGGHRGKDPAACGFYVRSPGSKIVLKGKCNAKANCAGGFVAAHGARINATDSTASGNGGPGAAVRRGATGTFTKCVFKGAKAAAGVEVCDMGTSAELFACTATENACSGVCLRDGAKLTDKGTRALANASAGWYVDGVGTRATMEGVKAWDNRGCGVIVQQRAEVEAAECVIEANASTGVLVHACGSATLRQCWVLRSKDGSGVSVADDESVATLVSCVVASNQAYGALVQDAAVLEAWGADTTGPSFFDKNRLSNVCALTRASVRFQNCTMRESVERSGLNVNGRGTRANLKNCTLAANALCGLIAQNGVWLEGAQITVSDNVQAGVCVHTAATADLRRVLAEKCRDGSGLFVHGEASAVTVADFETRDNGEAGMRAQEGGKIEASNVQTSGNGKAGAMVDVRSEVVLHNCCSTDSTPYVVPKGRRHVRMVRNKCSPP